MKNLTADLYAETFNAVFPYYCPIKKTWRLEYAGPDYWLVAPSYPLEISRGYASKEAAKIAADKVNGRT